MPITCNLLQAHDHVPGWMKEIVIQISVLYRGDGKPSASKVVDTVADLLLTADREQLFQNGATYAGYTVALQPKDRKKIEPSTKISKSTNK